MRHRLGQAERITVPFRILSYRVSMAVMLLISCGLLLFGRAEAYVFDDARTKTVEIMTPVMDWMSTPLVMVRNWLGNFDDYFDIYEKNRLLREENNRLLAWKSRALHLEQVANRYKDLLGVQLEPEISYISGRVVSDSGGPFVHTLIINTGRKQEVAEGQAVVDRHGFIGRVVGTGRNASRILLISDLNSRVPVMVEPSQDRAVMTGDNTSRPQLEFLSDSAEIKAGDRVVTSGAGGMLPPSLPVGVAVQTGNGKFRVQPFSEPARAAYVRVLRYEFPDEIEPKTNDEDAAEVESVDVIPQAPAPAPAPQSQAPASPPPPPPETRPQVPTGSEIQIMPLGAPSDSAGDEDG